VSLCVEVAETQIFPQKRQCANIRTRSHALRCSGCGLNKNLIDYYACR